jgi:hypothetical protein
MRTARAEVWAARLRDGRVLVVGGDPDAPDGMLQSSAEVFDPVTGRFARVGPLLDTQWVVTATVLADGRALVIGELADATLTDTFATAEVYDPATGLLSRTGAMGYLDAPQTAVAFPDGRALVLGWPIEDAESDGPPAPGPCEVFDPATGSFSGTGLSNPYVVPVPIVLRDGRVLVVGDDGTAFLYRP